MSMFEDYTLEDAVLRPTNKPWKCQNCGIELLTREVIIGHKERCKPKTEAKTTQKQPLKLEHDLRKKGRVKA